MSDHLPEQLRHALAGSYRIGRELGGGGMSRVFLAEDTRFGRSVVVKVLAPELMTGVSAERFQREIQVTAALQQANIVPVLDAGDVAGLPYFVMPYVEGQSLRARLASGGPLPTSECLGIMRDVARALGYAHERGIVHRDIKPDNVLLSRGTAEVTDFGIAKALAAARVEGEPGGPADSLTALGTSVGTPTYMSPEQVAGDSALDHRADIYSLGVLAFEMHEGHPPFQGAPQSVMAAHLAHPPPALTPRTDDPPALPRIIGRCLEKDARNRYQSADELLADIDAVTTAAGAAASPGRAHPRRWLTAAVIAAALLAATWVGTSGRRNARWVRSEAIPRIKEYADLAQFDSAWLVARKAQALLPGDSTLATLWPRFARKVVLRSDPEGARVFRAEFGDTAAWVLLGTTPTDSIYLPTAIGHLRVERAGYRTLIGLMGASSRTFLLTSDTSPDSGMVRVPGGTFGAFLVGLDRLPPQTLGEYLMDQHEVTNRQYKKFVDAGGYRRREFWPDPITDGDRRLSWEAAMARFVDRSGQPGPSTWEAGSYPSDQAELPVAGVSWYEAAAYARFAGKSLPTIFHWAHAASIGAARFMVTGSNFEARAPRRGSTFAGVSPYGVFDLAGNVREWCENATGDGQRYILGGGWSDTPYGFTDGYAQPAMDRAEINGIRLVKYLSVDTALAHARAPQPRAFTEYARERPVSDAVFEGFRNVFEYDPAPLNARLEVRDTTDENWILERVSFDAAYGKERVLATLLLPRNARQPYQPVVYFPGSGTLNLTSSLERRDQIASFVVKTGRALVLPVLKSTYERRDSLRSDLPDESIFWREHAVMWVKDMRRTLDYLETRADMDTSRVAYFGFSWGANMAPLNLVADRRFKTAVLYVAGLTMERGRPEVDPFHYLPRVTVPVLMMNGRYDFFFPLETAQRPFFEGLGTPTEHKAWKVYEGGHDVPRAELIKETIAWLDRYLGRSQQ